MLCCTGCTPLQKSIESQKMTKTLFKYDAKGMAREEEEEDGTWEILTDMEKRERKEKEERERKEKEGSNNT